MTVKLNGGSGEILSGFPNKISAFVFIIKFNADSVLLIHSLPTKEVKIIASISSSETSLTIFSTKGLILLATFSCP